MPRIAPRASRFRRSAIRELFSAPATRTDLIHLEIGEPMFATPPEIIAEAVKGLHRGETHYPPAGGRLQLRNLIAEKIRSINHYEVAPSEIAVTAGAATALFALLQVLLEPGDEILIPTPGYPNLAETVRMVGAVPVFYSLSPEDDYRPDLADIEGGISARSRVLFTISPSNPTGAVLSEGDFAGLLEIANRHDLWLVADEVYDQLVLDDDVQHFSPAALDVEGRVISLYSFSKTYAMTGWRIGYVAGPQELIDTLIKLELHGTYTSVVSQLGAEAALQLGAGRAAKMREVYRSRRDLAWHTASELGLKAVRPEGGLFMLVGIPDGVNDTDFVNSLKEEQGVIVAPGRDFGPTATNYVRVCYSVDELSLVDGLNAIAGEKRR